MFEILPDSGDWDLFSKIRFRNVSVVEVQISQYVIAKFKGGIIKQIIWPDVTHLIFKNIWLLYIILTFKFQLLNTLEKSQNVYLILQGAIFAQFDFLSIKWLYFAAMNSAIGNA